MSGAPTGRWLSGAAMQWLCSPEPCQQEGPKRAGQLPSSPGRDGRPTGSTTSVTPMNEPPSTPAPINHPIGPSLNALRERWPTAGRCRHYHAEIISPKPATTGWPPECVPCLFGRDLPPANHRECDFATQWERIRESGREEDVRNHRSDDMPALLPSFDTLMRRGVSHRELRAAGGQPHVLLTSTRCGRGQGAATTTARPGYTTSSRANLRAAGAVRELGEMAFG
ncbi:hypothetical protein GA0115254_110629 [Streptomyces sp. Ncost-T10-10d]|nr:hypothetical protein GA0115254_110629 [Streptomyces sp. Ncost-T10-10d]